MSSLIGFIGKPFPSLLFAPTVRGRSLRLSILILLVIGVSLAALIWRDVNVNIPGVTRLERGGSGPLCGGACPRRVVAAVEREDQSRDCREAQASKDVSGEQDEEV